MMLCCLSQGRQCLMHQFVQSRRLLGQIDIVYLYVACRINKLKEYRTRFAVHHEVYEMVLIVRSLPVAHKCAIVVLPQPMHIFDILLVVFYLQLKVLIADFVCRRFTPGFASTMVSTIAR